MIPFFSIIIPTYNSALTLSSALNSIVEQSFAQVEVLIIDGASTDNTLAIAQQYYNSIATLKIISEPDKGIYDAMNKGMQHASGTWLYFMGSDDSLFNNTVLQQVHDACIDCNNTTHVVYGNVQVVGNVSWAPNNGLYDGEFDVKKLLTKNICHQSMFYRNSFVQQHQLKFSLNYPVCGDWDFNLQCFAKTNFLFFNQTIAFFNAGGASSIPTNDAYPKKVVYKFIEYFKVTSYYKLKEVLPHQLFTQLLKEGKFKYRFWLQRKWHFFKN